MLTKHQEEILKYLVNTDCETTDFLVQFGNSRDVWDSLSILKSAGYITTTWGSGELRAIQTTPDGRNYFVAKEARDNAANVVTKRDFRRWIITLIVEGVIAVTALLVALFK